jgi:hypothetical protein
MKPKQSTISTGEFQDIKTQKPAVKAGFLCCNLVPKAGVEPARPEGNGF